MRETNINKDIDRTDIKVGDKILISREVTVKKVRETTIYGGTGKPRKPITIVDTDTESMGVTADESVKLLERDKVDPIAIPTTAVLISWKDDDGYDHYARRNEVSEEWTTSDNGPKSTYTTAALIEAIEDDEFDGYEEGSLEIIKRKANFASGGVIPGIKLGEDSLNKLRQQLGQNIVAPNHLGLYSSPFGA